MPAFAPNKHIARSRYRDAILADNPLFYFRMKFGRDQTFPVGIVDETNQWTATFEESLSGSGTSLIPASSGLIKADASPSLGWTGNFWAGASIPHDTALHPKGSFSVEVWIGDWTDSKQKMIMSKDIQGSVWAEFTLFMTTSGQIQTQLLQQAGLTNISDITSPLSYNDGLTHHIVMVFDTDANLHMLYIDGELVVSNPWTFTLYTNTVDIAFGYQPDIGVPADANNASLDEVAMYHYALTPGQIAHHYDVGTAFYRNYREVVRTTGPVSYWRLGGGSIVDDVMKVNDLTLVGPIVQGVTSPMYLEDHNKDSCMKFDGVNTVVTTAGSPRASTLGINGKHVAPGGCAIEFWMYPRSFSTFTAIISTERTTDAGWLVYLRPDPTFPHLTMLTRAVGPTPDGWQTLGLVKIKQWSHVVINYEFNTACTIFIDGVDVGTSQIFTPITAAGDDTGNPIDIGDAPGDDTGIVPFDGYLSDVAFYDRALTEAEAGLHYRESQIQIATEDFFGYEPGNFFPANFNPSWTIISLTADSRFDIIDAGVSAQIPEKHLQGVAVTTTNSGAIITYKDVPEFKNGTIQMEAVFDKVVADDNNQIIIMARYIDISNLIHIRLNSLDNRLDVIQYDGGVSDTVSTAYTWAANTLYYVEFVMDGGVGTATVYSDSDRSTVIVTTTHTALTNRTGKVGIYHVHGLNTDMNARFNNFRVDVVDRSIAYRSVVLGDNPTHYWRLGELLGTNAVDETGAQDLTYTDVTLGVTGLITNDSNTAVLFGQLNGQVTVAGNDGTLTLPYTLEAWVSIPASVQASEFPIIVGTNQDLSNYYGLQIQFNTDTRTIGIQMGDGGGSGPSNRKTFVSVGTIPNDTPTHVVGVITDINTVAIYFNGILQSTTTSGTATIISYAAGQLIIGRNRVSSQSADFVIDEVVLYEGIALTAQQVLAHYTAGI